MIFDNTGKIIIVSNIIFKDFFKGNYVLTPDPHLARPCLIISELEDKRYILPISSSKKNEKYLYKNYKLDNDNMLFNTLTKKNCYVKLDKIIPIEPYYREPVDEIETLHYYKCLLKLKKYYDLSKYESEEYEIIKHDVNKQLKKLKNICKL